MVLFYFLKLSDIKNVVVGSTKIRPNPKAVLGNQEVFQNKERVVEGAKREDQVQPANKQPVLLPANSGRQVTVPILMYHFIGNNPDLQDKVRDNLSVTPDKFEEQMEFLAREGYKTMVLDTLYGVLQGKDSLPAKPIILTFDDGYVDFYVNAYPILKKHNFGAVVFIPTGLMGMSYYLNWDQIKEMAVPGLISFQAHSVNHLDLTALLPEKAEYEIKESKKILESKLGHLVNSFAYPYGLSSSLVQQMVKNAGYVGALGTREGNIESESNVLNMPRIKVAGGMSLEDFRRKVRQGNL